jgi:hypothetical protein
MSVGGHCEALRSADADARMMWKLHQRLSLRRVQSSTSVEFILSSCLLRVIVHSKINLLLGTFSYFIKLFSRVGTDIAGNFQLYLTVAVLLETVYLVCVTQKSAQTAGESCRFTQQLQRAVCQRFGEGLVCAACKAT